MSWWKIFGRRTAPPASKSEPLLQAAMEALDCHFALFDPERRLVLHNSSYAALHAKSWDSLPRPLRYDDLMRAAIRNGPPCADEDAELASRIAAHERSGVQHFERLYPGGRWMRVSRCRLPDGHVAGLSLDISPLKAREAATAASEARYRALVDTASVGIWHLNEQGQTLFANDRLGALFGGAAPTDLTSAGLVWDASDGAAGPFGFPAGRETRAVVSARPGHSETAVLVASSSWVPLTELADASGRREEGAPVLAAVLTLIDVSALEAARARAEHLAWHDVLTGLPNRAAFQRALDDLLSEAPTEAALLLVDLDEFKAVNDRHGHAAGDALLREVAVRMRAALRPGDLACRIGGDEFAVLLRGKGMTEQAAAAAARLSHVLQQPVWTESAELPLSASIGHAGFPSDGANTETLQHAADLALYQVKREGRGGVAAYTRALSEAQAQQRQLRAALAGAIALDEFQLVWQKQVVAAGGTLRGAEALLRWPSSPLGRAVSPAEFLPAAAEAGLMPAIDAWVLDTALRQAREWSGRPEAPPLIGINISAGSLRDPTFPPRVATGLLRYGVPASALEIEIPEDVAACDLDALEPVLEELRAIGVRLALDDFGGGLSSVAHLVRLPVDVVKLDRSVVAGLPDGSRAQAVLKAVAGITRSMGIPLLAEGVENEAQVFILRRQGCETMQGFLYGKPVSATELVPPARHATAG